jgi:hypothetical protein
VNQGKDVWEVCDELCSDWDTMLDVLENYATGQLELPAEIPTSTSDLDNSADKSKATKTTTSRARSQG